MSLISKMRKQIAVYWAIADEPFDSHGRPVFADPVEISCRWEDKTEKFVDQNGEEVLSQAKVFVDRDVCIGGVLMLGSIGSGLNLTDPKKNVGAYEIRRFEKLPNLKVTEYLRTVYL